MTVALLAQNNLSDLDNALDAQSNLGIFPEITAVEISTTTFPVHADVIRTVGYAAPGDGGGACYRRVASEPAHLAKFQSDDEAWWELAEPITSWRMFGAHPDNTATDNSTAWARARGYCVATGASMLIPTGVYETVNTLATWSGMYVEWQSNAWIKPQPLPTPIYSPRWADSGSTTGGILTNVADGWGPNYVQSLQYDITLVNPRFDMADVVGDNAMGFARSGGENLGHLRVLYPHVKNARAHDGTVGGYGAKGVIVEHGWKDALVFGGLVEGGYTGYEAQGIDYEDYPSGSDLSATRIRFVDCFAVDCEHWIQLKGGSGTYSVAPSTDVDVMSVHVVGGGFWNCGHPVSPTKTDASGQVRQKGGPISLMNARNCSVTGWVGYSQPTYPETDPGYPVYNAIDANTGSTVGGMSGPIGAIVYGWGRNVTVQGTYHGDAEQAVAVRRNTAAGDSGIYGTNLIGNTYEWDINLRVHGTLQTALRGEILNGMLTGTAQGGGANTITLATNESIVDHDYNGRGIVLSSGTGSGQTNRCIGYDGMTKVLTVKTAWTITPDATTVYSILGPNLAPANDLVQGRLCVAASSFSRGLVDRSVQVWTGVDVSVRDISGVKEVCGTAAQIFSAGNTLASFPRARTDLRDGQLNVGTRSTSLYTGLITDDNLVTVTPPKSAGVLRFWLPASQASSAVAGQVFFRATSSPGVESLGVGSNVALGTTLLTVGASDGTDNRINIAVTNNMIQFKNRLGASRGWQYTFDVEQ